MSETDAPGNDQLTAIASDLVHAAKEKGIALRVLGGVAVFMTCPSVANHPSLQRKLKDLDLTVPRQDMDRLPELFTPHGLKLRKREPSRMTFEKPGIEVEAFAPDFVQHYRIDLTGRLSLSSPTLPLADLLLIKMQRDPIAEKDIQDAIALLLDHPVGKGEASGQINAEYIARLGGQDWGLFQSVYANTIKLEQVVDRFLGLEEQRQVWRRVELIQEEMDRQPKSFGWMIQQILRRPMQVAG